MVCVLGLAAAGRAQAPLTNVTGTFLTPGGQTPAAAGLRTIATIGGTAVYGTVDFTPLNSAANLPNAILCGGVTYIPQPVRGWISATGTLLNNAGTAGVNLVPTIGCQPTGLVMQAKIAFAPSADGRIQSVVWIEQKQIPQTSTVDWGSLSLASTIVPAFSYQLSSGGTINDFENWTPIAQPANPASGARTWFDVTSLKFSCVTSTGANCNPGGGGGGATLQTNGTNNSSQTTLNLQNSAATNGLTLTFTNASAGNVQLGLSGTLSDAGLASGYSGTGSCSANNWINSLSRNAAPGCAQVGFSNLSGSIALGQTPLTTRGDLLLVNSTPALARLAIGGANLYPKSNGTDVVYSTLAAGGVGSCSANQYVNALNADAAPGCAQVAYSQISGTPTLFYQTLQSGGTAQTQRPAFNFIQGSNVTLTIVDNSGSNRTDITIAASSSAGARWDQLANPTANLSLAHGNNNTLFTWGSATGSGQDLFKLTDTSGNTGSGFLAHFTTASSSSLKPFQADANGNGVTMGTNGTLTKVGTGGLDLQASVNLPGSNGQLLYNNAGAVGAEDPIVSYNYVNLFNAISATATQTSSTVRVSTFGQYGELIATWAGITGSPASCTLQVKSADSLGNLTNNGSAVAVAPANGTSAILFTPSIYTSAQMQVVYAGCSPYPTAGTLSLDFVPSVTAYSAQGPQGAQGSPWWIRPTDGANNMPMMDAAARAGFQKITDGTNTAAVKAASTAAAATDPSLVVQISPNQPAFTVTAQQATFANLKGQSELFDSAGNGLTSNSTTTTSKFGLDINVLSILGTAPTTAGFLDIKGADGNVFVRQATFANLKAQAELFDSAGNGITSNSTTTTSKFGADVNILSILGTAPTTAGFLDIKGADGNVFVRQATAANLNATVVGNLGDNGAAATTNRIGVLPAIAESNMPAAQTAGRDTSLRTDLHGNLLVAPVPETSITTYTASAQGLAPAASPTDISVLPGNATNTVIVTRAELTCTQTTAGIADVRLIKRSAADTAGTSSAMTIVPLDSNNAAASSAPLTYTANPTTGTAVGDVDSEKIGFMAPATASPNDVYVWSPAKYGQSVVLRGTAQQLAINLNGVTLSGGSCDVAWHWIETTGL